MKKKILSTAMATALLVTMFSGTAMAASAPEWGENGGSTEVPGYSYTVSPTIEVELPGDLSFGINPLYLDADGDPETNDKTQIVSGEYLIYNYSDVDVLITAETKTTLAEDVVLTADPTVDATTKELPKVSGKKNVYLVQMYPQSIEVDSDQNVTVTRNTFTLGTTTASTVAGKPLSKDANVSILFKLKAYDYENDVLKTGNVGGFTFDGAVDPDAAYADEDITVTTTFTVNTLTTNQGNAYVGVSLNGARYDATVVQVSGNSVSGN